MSSLFPVNPRLILILTILIFTPLSAQYLCPSFTDPHTKTVDCNPGDNLSNIIYNATSGTTFLLANGTYKVPAIIQMHIDDITIRSKSGNRDSVVLDGNTGALPAARANFTPEVIAVSASRVVIADLTICHAYNHGIHAYAPASRGTDSLFMHNIRVYDCGQQLIKVNSNGQTPPSWVDRGILECSLIEFIDNSVMEPVTGGYYTGGLDVHGGWDWVIRGNTFRNIQRNAAGMEHAVHMWNKCRGTIVENNRFENVYRAIGFGMNTSPGSFERHYPDNAGDSPYFDHIGGMIRNNTMFNAAGIHLETAVELMNVSGAEVYHNTVASIDAPFNSMEYRWPNTSVILNNNLTSDRIMPRDGASAFLGGNLENAPASLFSDYNAGNLHLAPTASAAIDKGIVLAAGKAGVDMDGQQRDAAPDIGADEYYASTVLSDVMVKKDKGMGLKIIKRAANGSVDMFYTVASAGPVKIAVYDANGKLVRNVFDGYRQIGSHSAMWDGRDGNGQIIENGVYIINLAAAGRNAARMFTTGGR